MSQPHGMRMPGNFWSIQLSKWCSTAGKTKNTTFYHSKGSEQCMSRRPTIREVSTINRASVPRVLTTLNVLLFKICTTGNQDYRRYSRGECRIHTSSNSWGLRTMDWWDRKLYNSRCLMSTSSRMLDRITRDCSNTNLTNTNSRINSNSHTNSRE